MLRKFLFGALSAIVLFGALSSSAFAAAPPAKQHPKPVPLSKHMSVAPATNVKPSVNRTLFPGPVNPQHPPITLLVTDYQLRLVLTRVGWVYVRVPVQYYVTAVWNPVYQAYGYYDQAGLYHLYQAPVPVPVPGPVPVPVPLPRPR